MVQPLVKDTPKSIATKGTKKPQNNAFADFMKNLGKTTASKKNSGADIIKADFKADAPKSTKMDSADSTKVKKDEILSTILKGKNEEVKSPKPPQNPLDILLQRPKATHMSLTSTPQIKQDSTQGAIESPKTQNASPNLGQNLQDSTQTPKIPQNQQQNKMQNTPQSTSQVLAKTPQDSTQTLSPNLTQNQTPKIPAKESSTENATQDLTQTATESPKNKNIQPSKTQKNAESSLQNLADKTQPQDTPPNLSQNLEQNLGQNTQDSTQTPKIPQNQTTPTPQELAKNATDSTQILSQNLPQDSMQNAPQSTSTLGIKNTLKYGAFAAFDALSLLKPSDGKKLSDLIKKADELSLNLQSIKYTKIGDSKAIFSNATPLDSTPTQENATQNAVQETLKIDLKDTTKLAAAPKSEETSQSPQEKQPKLESKPAESPKENNAKSEIKLEPKDTPKDSTPKQAEIAESKSIESPLKNALNPKESDIKPINFKAENKAESTKTPQESQNIPLANADATTKIEHKIFDARETMRHFASSLKQEIQNYKPPLSKITIELQPANLGSVEVSIISQGKNIQIQLHSNQQTLNLFIQNQSDLRNALTQIGYENVAMSFNNGSQMGFSDNSGKWRYERSDKFRNTFGLNNQSEENEEIFEIMITNNYA